MLASLERTRGATIPVIMQATGWQPHSVRGFLTSVVRKRLGLTLTSDKIDGERVYRVIAGKRTEEKTAPCSRRRAGCPAMSPTNDISAIEAEIDRIRSLGVAALRARWRSLFSAPQPDGLSKGLIGRMITYRIQEEAFGGLDHQALKLMDRLARGGKAGSEVIRHLKAGTVLVREHGGARHTVTVVPGGFAWNGAIYPSLSSIARAITGTAWNGPRFFGLTKANKPEKNEPVQRRGTERAPLRARRSRHEFARRVTDERRSQQPAKCAR